MHVHEYKKIIFSFKLMLVKIYILLKHQFLKRNEKPKKTLLLISDLCYSL